MTLLAVRRPNLTLAGRRFERGDTFDSAELPGIDQHKWAQLIDHRIIDMIDKPGASADLTCGDCGYIASNPSGLKVHQGRKHKEP